ncbi:MAG: hypothetical protein U1E24_07525, partial [Phenylobacterium sp.]|nr:hypothetical protein [Phenylobacterium sp.]
MTIRTNLNVSALSCALADLEEADPSTIIGDVLDAMFSAGKTVLELHGLTMPNDDGWRESESVIFDAIRRKNPGR